MLFADGHEARPYYKNNQLVTNFFCEEVRLHLGRKNKNLRFYFVLRSVCTNFFCEEVRIRLNNENKKSSYFILHCLRLSLTLQLLLQSKGKNITVAAMVEW